MTTPSIVVSETETKRLIKVNVIKLIVTAAKLLSFLTLFTLFLLPVSGQNRNSQATIDNRLRTSAKVDPATHAMQLQVNLGTYKGRNGRDFPITLSYSSKVWRVGYVNTQTQTFGEGSETYSTYNAMYAESSASGWTSNLDGMLWPWPTEKEVYDVQGHPISVGENVLHPNVVFRGYQVFPDGSRHEMRQDTILHNQGDVPVGPYYSTDGTRMKSDLSTHKILMADGTQFYTDYDSNSQPLRDHFVDRNGNDLVYDRVAKVWTDTLGRQFASPLAQQLQQMIMNSTPVPQLVAGEYTYTLPGVNGTTLTYTLRWTNLSSALTDPAQQLEPVGDGSTPTGIHPCNTTNPCLFQSTDTEDILLNDHTTLFNPVVLSQIILPNGSTYTFTYDIYGRVNKILYPTGSYERFTYDKVLSINSINDNPMTSQGDFGITDQFVSPTGLSSDEAHWHFQVDIGGTFPNKTFGSTVIAPDSTKTTSLLFSGCWNSADHCPAVFDFEDPRTGRAYDEQVYSSTGQLLRRKLSQWTVDGTVQIWGANNGAMYETSNPRVTQETEFLFDTGGNALAKSTVYTYDQDLNVTATDEYDYVSVDSNTAQTVTVDNISTISLGTKLRRTETTYLVNDPSIAPSVQSSYRALNLIALPTSATVKDGSGNVVAQTLYTYDEQTPGLITYSGAPANWIDAGQYRGNVTTTQRLVNPTTNTYVTTHVQYDESGNPCVITDALGNQSQIMYSSTYSYAYPTQTISAIPDPTGVQGSSTALTTSTVYDLNTGLVTSSTDANGQMTTYAYNDSLDRPSLVTRPDGGTTAYSYGDNPGNLFIRTQTSITSSSTIDKYLFFDAAGRPSRSFLNEGTTYIATDTQYDLMGRVSQTSNPYRVNTLTDPVNPSGLWTVNAYDSLGRVVTVTAVDGSKIQTAYSGNLVTVTDPALKSRQSQTDALGRLIQVIEDPGGLGYVTAYSYDALDDLIGVTQCGTLSPCLPTTTGVQTRAFAYDSLKRLTQATNPESGTVNYTYDNNGNLRTKTDARNMVTSFTYDALNRVVSKTPGFNTRFYYYDAALPTGAPTFNRGYSLGRLVAATYQGDDGKKTDGNYYGYDVLGRVVHKTQITDGFSYNIDATYDLAGDMTSETYPTAAGFTGQRTVNHGFDSAGRLSSLNSPATSYNSAVISLSNLSYAAHGGLLSETYGNGLTHSIAYNSRLQPSSIGLSSAATGVSSLQLTYTYSSTGTDNNGNVLTETSAIGTNIFAQTFVYDSLNRLTSAYEIDNGGSTPAWQQAYVYDRYGNRQLHNDGSTTSPPDVTFNQKNQIVGMTYDASGNLTNDGRHTYFFNAENMMTGFDSVPNDYEYDGEGNRVKNSSISSYMIYDIEDKLIQEVSLNTCFTRTCRQSQLPHLLKEHVYGADGVLSTIVPNGAAEYLTPDHLGTPRVVTDANTGTVLSWHDYQPFGEEITATSPAAGARSNITQFDGSNNPRQKFTSKERDTETGLDFFNARYYSNAQGRFTSADSSRLSMRLRDPQSWNRYAYVLNNPLIYIDPSGLVFVRNNNTGQIYFYDNIKSQEQATKELGKQFEVVTGAYIDAAAAASLQSQGYKVKVGQQVTLSANGHISLDGNGEPNTTSHAGVPLFPTERQFVKLPLIVFTAESTPLALGFITLTGVGSTTLGLSSSFTVDEAVSLGLLNGTSKLAQVLRTIQSGFNAANPSSMLESMKILNQAVESLGLGPGVVVEGGPTAGYITLQNVGGVLTTILSTGEIVVTKGGDVLMRLKP